MGPAEDEMDFVSDLDRQQTLGTPDPKDIQILQALNGTHKLLLSDKVVLVIILLWLAFIFCFLLGTGPLTLLFELHVF